jgi:alpha-galactosidase
MTSRRDFVERAALAAAGLAAPVPGLRQFVSLSDDPPSARSGFPSVVRPPDVVSVQATTGGPPTPVALARAGGNRWTAAGGILVSTIVHGGSLHVALTAPSTAISRIHLRWRGRITGTPAILGDAWERGYGDLEWRGWVPDRIMPWYFALHDGALTHACGVRTNCSALCCWQVDPDGISLWADVRSGGTGVTLGQRTLDVCDVVSRSGRPGESAFAALHAFCRQMCPAPLMPPAPVYGSNDWYAVYGDNSAESVRADAARIVELSPAIENRPFAVIDDGWQPGGGRDKPGAGAWDRGNEKFPDMPALAAEVRRAGARPGIWIRPLQAAPDSPAGWRLAREPGTLDPSVPETLQKVTDDVARLHHWGFDLIKHDYTTFDIFGRWGFQMGGALTRDGWRFAGGTGRTTAEIIDELYRTIRTAAAGTLLIGCNTVSHLSAGRFEICRIGDDTSGTEWARTRRMGVNSLAFRGVQHATFYVADPDCVGVTTAVPWKLNRQWLDLVARSGTMLSVSLAADALNAEVRRDLRAALALAAVPQPLAEPLDWAHAVYPERWRMRGELRTFDWVGSDGAGPLPAG